MTEYEAVIGIETHVQLKTKTKLFCGCDNDARDLEPNTTVCPVCMGFPGTLPVLNCEAVRLAIRAGTAMGAHINTHTKFDRKNYFYPDLPKGYQITQFDQPIVGHGELEVPMDGETFKVGITRAHLEEDAGKLVHPAGADYSLVDYNRAGTPLLEIVSEPDMRTPAEARAYAQELYNIVRYAEVSDANLYYGNMRFDVNVSVRPKGSDQLGTRTETKNINSFRAVERTVKYEIQRQTKVLDDGGKIVQETRGWNEDKGETFSQRSKEEAHDYRYFPEPDLPPLVLTSELRHEAVRNLETPALLRRLMHQRGLSDKEAAVLINEPLLVQLFTEATHKHPQFAKRIGDWLAVEVIRTVSDPDFNAASFELGPEDLVELSEMVEGGQLNSTAAKTVLAEAAKVPQSPNLIAECLNLMQLSNEEELVEMVRKVLADNPSAVADFRAGKPQAIGFLIGAAMKLSGGKANPPLVKELLLKELNGNAE